MFVGGNAEYVGIVVTARFDGLDGRIANGSTNALVTVGLHSHTLTRTAKENAEVAWVGIGGHGDSDFFGIVIIVILGVVGVGTKISEGNLATLEPTNDAGFELETAMVGAEVDVHIRIDLLDQVCRGRQLIRRDDCCSPIRYRTKQRL